MRLLHMMQTLRNSHVRVLTPGIPPRELDPVTDHLLQKYRDYLLVASLFQIVKNLFAVQET